MQISCRRIAIAALWGLVGVWLVLAGNTTQAQVPDSLPTRADTLPVQVIERGQIDTLAAPSDSLVYISGQDTANIVAVRDSLWPQPRRALRRSLLFPGLGQIYNRSYWKLPFVYGAIGTTVGFAVLNHQRYATANEAYQASTSSTNEAGDVNLRADRDYYRRTRDLFFILTALGYALTAVESYVDAHLKHFDVSEDLSLHISPGVQWQTHSGTAQAVPSLGLRVRFR